MLKIVWTLTPLFSLWKVKYIQLASINSIAKWTIVLAWHSIKSSILPPFACNLLFMHDLFAFSNLSLLKCPVWGSNSRPSDYETDALPTALTRLLCKLRVQMNVLLQWHSRLARRTYMSVTTKKCEGREFEPPLEQVSFEKDEEYWLYFACFDFFPSVLAKNEMASVGVEPTTFALLARRSNRLS